MPYCTIKYIIIPLGLHVLLYHRVLSKIIGFGNCISTSGYFLADMAASLLAYIYYSLDMTILICKASSTLFVKFSAYSAII